MLFIAASAQWNQVGNTINDPDYTQLGDAIDISSDGSIIAVGEPAGNIPLYTGQVEIFSLQSGSWTLVGNPITGASTDDGFGYAVSLNGTGTIVAIGAPYNDDAGSNVGTVQVFQYDSGAWNQLGSTLTGEVKHFGYALSLNEQGTILAIGEREHDNSSGAQAGRVYVYELSGNEWVLKGSVIDGESGGVQAGWDVDLSASGLRLAIGSPTYDDNANINAGQVKVFDFINNDWTLVGSAIIGADYGDEFGTSVDLNAEGNVLAVGSIDNSDIEMEAGMVSIFRLESGTWNQIGSNIHGETENEGFGYTVSLDSLGKTLAVGCELMSSSASVRIFENQLDSWVETDSIGGNVCSLNNPGTVAVTGASLGGQGTVRVFTTEITNSINSNQSLNVNVFPNPVRDVVNIRLNSIGYISVLDMQGNIITEQKIQENATLNTTNLNDGVYLLRIQTGNKLQTSRIIVLH